MNAKTLEKRYEAKRHVYRSLADECRSVPELMFKIEIYGDTWTKWDWVMFFHYLDWSANCPEEDHLPRGISVWNPLYGWKDRDAEDANPEKTLLDDIFHTLDAGNTLDSVLTNKTVLMNLITWLDLHDSSLYGLLRILAHVFRKFPELWKMNWMFIRHRGKNKAKPRTHRLASYVFPANRRTDEYFASDALRDDFIYKYYSKGA